MSFWKSVGDLAMKAGSAVASEAKAAGQRANEYKEQIDTRAYQALMKYEVNIND